MDTLNRRLLARMLDPIRRRISLLATRAVGRLVDPSQLMQELQLEVLAGELLNRVEHAEPYGFTSNPKPGFEGFVVNLGGNRDHPVCIVAADRRYRPQGLESGEVCLHTDEDKPGSDHRIVFKRGKEIHLIAGASSIVMTPAGITITTPSYDIVKAT